MPSLNPNSTLFLLLADQAICDKSSARRASAEADAATDPHV